MGGGNKKKSNNHNNNRDKSHHNKRKWKLWPRRLGGGGSSKYDGDSSRGNMSDYSQLGGEYDDYDDNKNLNNGNGGNYNNNKKKNRKNNDNNTAPASPSPPSLGSVGGNRRPPRYVAVSPAESGGDVSNISTPSGLQRSDEYNNSNGHGHGHGNRGGGGGGGGGGKRKGGRQSQQQQQQQQQQYEVPHPNKIQPLLPPLAEDSSRGSSTHGGRSLFSTPGGSVSRNNHQGNSEENNSKMGGGGGGNIVSNQRGASFLTKSKQFRKLSRWAFGIIDTDHSGTVDQKELYAGLLLIHLQLAAYAGPAACKPVTREYANAVFEKMDVDNSGTLDESEFIDIMVVLCSQIMSRVLFQWSMTLLVVPILSKQIIDAFFHLWHLWKYNEHIVNVRCYVEEVIWEDCIQYYFILGWKQLLLSYPQILHYMDTIQYYSKTYIMDYIPDGVVETVPVTTITIILGSLLVPYCLFKIDQFFNKIADQKVSKKKRDMNFTSSSTTTTTTNNNKHRVK